VGPGRSTGELGGYGDRGIAIGATRHDHDDDGVAYVTSPAVDPTRRALPARTGICRQGYPRVVSELERQFEFYLANQDAIVEEYADRFVVIAGQQVVDDFPTETEARSFAEATLQPETYTVQFVSAGQEPFPTVY
jgi:hypothetical protein